MYRLTVFGQFWRNAAMLEQYCCQKMVLLYKHCTATFCYLTQIPLVFLLNHNELVSTYFLPFNMTKVRPKVHKLILLNNSSALLSILFLVLTRLKNQTITVNCRQNSLFRNTAICEPISIDVHYFIMLCYRFTRYSKAI